MGARNFDLEIRQWEDRIRAGDTGGYIEWLHARFGASLIAYFRDCSCPGEHTAEDLLQELFTDLCRKVQRIRPSAIPEFDGSVEGLRAYLFGFARHLVSSVRRHRRAQRRGGTLRSSDFDTAGAVPSGESQPWECAASREEIDALRRALDQLDRDNPRQAAAVELRHIDGLSFTAIGEILGVGEAGAKSLERRALVAIDSILAIRRGARHARAAEPSAPEIPGEGSARA